MATTYDDLFGGKFLKATDVPDDEDLVLSIKDYAIEAVGAGKDEKLILRFREIDKSLVVNKTNAETIAELYGKDFDDWLNKKITVFIADVPFQGKIVPSVRVRPRVPKPRRTEAEINTELGFAEPEPEY